MHFTRIAALVTACALATACGSVLEPTRPATDVSPGTSPEYAVYAAVLDSLFARDVAHPRYVLSDSTFVLRADTTDDWASVAARWFGPLFAHAATATLPSFRAQGTQRIALRAADIHTLGTVELVSDPELRTIFVRNARPDFGWQSFYERYPGAAGQIRLSRVGLDEQGTHALVYVNHSCGGLCGDGGMVLLERRGDRWVVLKYAVMWVS